MTLCTSYILQRSHTDWQIYNVYNNKDSAVWNKERVSTDSSFMLSKDSNRVLPRRQPWHWLIPGAEQAVISNIINFRNINKCFEHQTVELNCYDSNNWYYTNRETLNTRMFAERHTQCFCGTWTHQQYVGLSLPQIIHTPLLFLLVLWANHLFLCKWIFYF